MLIFHKLFTNGVIFLEYHGVRDLSGRTKIATYGADKSKTPRHIAYILKRKLKQLP